jgi:hypothetical protein
MAPKKKSRSKSAKSKSNPLSTGESVALVLSLMLTHMGAVAAIEAGKDTNEFISSDVGSSAANIFELILDPGVSAARLIQKSGGNGDKMQVWDDISMRWITEKNYKQYADAIIEEFSRASRNIRTFSEDLDKNPMLAISSN